MVMFGKTKESGVWFSSVSDWRVLWFGHDALYVAAGKFRLRLIKPWKK